MASAQTVIVLIGSGASGLWVAGAVRKGYFRSSRLHGHYIYRRKQPNLYWMYVILVTGLCALFALVGIAQLSVG